VFSKLKSIGSQNILNGYMRYEMLGKCLVVRYELDAQKRLSTILKQQWNDVLDISCVRINGKDLTFVRDREEWWVCEQGDMNRVEDRVPLQRLHHERVWEHVCSNRAQRHPAWYLLHHFLSEFVCRWGHKSTTGCTST
jgi:hypothetical protein